MTFRRALGDFGERVAIAHLESKGYRIVATKFRVREGEIDVVAQRDGMLVFVEVKARRGTAMGSAVEGISARKAKRLLAAGEVFAARHPELPQDRRIDLIAIDLDASGRVTALEHVESAVEDG
jgi:putative endonuclease